MSLSVLSSLRTLCSEVSEVGRKDKDLKESADSLLRDFVDACGRYNVAVLYQVSISRSPEGAYGGDREAWMREAETANASRTRAHDAVISCYQSLCRFCRKYRRADLTLERAFPTDANRAKLGDLAHLIHDAVGVAQEIDETLFKKVK